MTKWICKLTKNRGQYRVTIPKKLVVKKLLEKENHVELDDQEYEKIIIRRLIYNGKKTVNRKTDINREDR